MSAEAAAAPLQVPAVCVAHRQAKQALLDELRSGSAGTRGIRRALAHLAELTDEALRTLEPISSPVSQHWLMKDSMRRRSAGSCAAWLSAGSSSNTSTSECGNSSPRP